jgi:hypothetical protein
MQYKPQYTMQYDAAIIGVLTKQESTGSKYLLLLRLLGAFLSESEPGRQLIIRAVPRGPLPSNGGLLRVRCRCNKSKYEFGIGDSKS